MPTALESEAVAFQVAEIARQVFVVELSGDPVRMYKEVLDLFLSCGVGDERVKRFVAEVNLRKFPQPLQIYLPRATALAADLKVMNTPLDETTPVQRKDFEWLYEDAPSKGYALSLFESIFGEIS